MGETRNTDRVFVGKCERTGNNLDNLGTDGRIILKWI